MSTPSVPRKGDYICTKDGLCGIVHATTPSKDIFQDHAGIELDVYTDAPWNGGERTNIGYSVPREQLDWKTFRPIHATSVKEYTEWLMATERDSEAAKEK